MKRLPWYSELSGAILPSAASPAWTVDTGGGQLAAIVDNTIRLWDTSGAAGTRANCVLTPPAAIRRTVACRLRIVATNGLDYATALYCGGLTKSFEIHYRSLTSVDVKLSTTKTLTFDVTQWHEWFVTFDEGPSIGHVFLNGRQVHSGAILAVAGANTVFGCNNSSGTTEMFVDWLKVGNFYVPRTQPGARFPWRDYGTEPALRRMIRR